jgi:predicted nucleotidyltransferase
MTLLRELAEELGTNERTLRRGLAQGLVRGRRPTPRRVELAAGEIRYLRANWQLLAAIREVLRTERVVRLAVLIGSAARGELRERSDVDLLVGLGDSDWRQRDRLSERLSRTVGRPVDLVSLEAVKADPLLLDAALREGRVVVDRDNAWPSLLADAPRIARLARRAEGRLRDELHELVSQLSDDR